MNDPVGEAITQGEALLELGRLDEAGAAFSTALAQDPGRWRAAVGLANVRVRQDRLEEARSAAELAVSLAPETAWCYRALAFVLNKMGKGDEARVAALEAVRLAPENHFGFSLLSTVLMTVNDRTGAIAAAERAVELSPESASAFAQLSAAQLRAEHWADAERAAREALARDPENAPAHNNLGVALLRQRRRDEAIPSLEHAARLDPSNTTIQRTVTRLSHFPGSRQRMTAPSRALAQDRRSARRLQPWRWDWGLLTRLRPWWWRFFEALPPQGAFVLHLIALGGVIVLAVHSPFWIVFAVLLALMLPRSVYRLRVWWSIRFPKRGSWRGPTPPEDPERAGL